MRVKKEVIDPDRIREVPREGFSWMDRRFVREGFIDPLPRECILVYFFLSAVSDARGLSFYGDSTVERLLKLEPGELPAARDRLTKDGLLLYRYPIYQLLALPQTPRASPGVPATSASKRQSRGGEPMSIKEFFRLIARETDNAC